MRLHLTYFYTFKIVIIYQNLTTSGTTQPVELLGFRLGFITHLFVVITDPSRNLHRPLVIAPALHRCSWRSSRIPGDPD
jgi:hypothetical protein